MCVLWIFLGVVRLGLKSDCVVSILLKIQSITLLFSLDKILSWVLVLNWKTHSFFFYYMGTHLEGRGCVFL